MFARLGPAQPSQGADVTARAVGALALAALAVIHVVDLPGTLGPTPLVGAGYLGIVAAAVLTGGVASSAITAMSATGAVRWALPRSAWRRFSSCSSYSLPGRRGPGLPRA